ncbi:hypothetical protein J6590_071279 [Homalodisca vitripennis]|nr:hypothetical protein J6590_071279 [Homalodisca vitripennis]
MGDQWPAPARPSSGSQPTPYTLHHVLYCYIWCVYSASIDPWLAASSRSPAACLINRRHPSLPLNLPCSGVLPL